MGNGNVEFPYPVQICITEKGGIATWTLPYVTPVILGCFFAMQKQNAKSELPVKILTLGDTDFLYGTDVLAIGWHLLCKLNLWLFDLKHVSHVALRSGIITKFELGKPIRSWFIRLLYCWYVMSRCDLDVWPLDIERLKCIGCHVSKLYTKFQWNRAHLRLSYNDWIFKIWAPSTILDWPEVDFHNYAANEDPQCKSLVKFQHNRPMRGSVIDNLVNFHCQRSGK